MSVIKPLEQWKRSTKKYTVSHKNSYGSFDEISISLLLYKLTVVCSTVRVAALFSRLAHLSVLSDINKFFVNFVRAYMVMIICFRCATRAHGTTNYYIHGVSTICIWNISFGSRLGLTMRAGAGVSIKDKGTVPYQISWYIFQRLVLEVFLVVWW